MSLAPPTPLIFLLLACFSLALGVLVGFKAPPSPVRNYFSLFAISVTAWLACGFLLYSNIDPPRAVIWARIAFAAGSILILSLYHVLLLFPDLKSSPGSMLINSSGTAFALLSLFSPLLARDVTYHGIFNIKVEYGLLFLPFTAYALVVLALGVNALVRSLRNASGLRRLQIQYLLLGTVIPVAGVLLTNLMLPLVFKVSVLAPYGRLLALIFLPLTAHAIIRHRLMDIRLFVQKAVVYGCAITAAALIFGGLLRVVAALTPGKAQISPDESIALGVFVAVLFHPVKHSIERALNRYVYREAHDYPKILRESSHRLGIIVDLRSMAHYLTGLVAESFKAEFVGVYLRDDTVDGFAPLALQRVGHGDPRAAAHFVSGASALIAFLQGDQRLLVRDEVSGNSRKPAIVEATAELQRLGGDLALALGHGGRLSGFLLLGPKLSGDPYFSEDIDFLLTLVGQAAVAIENVQLHRQMEEEKLRTERLAVFETMASGIAHEIKNPLVAIRTFAELLPERFREEEFHDQFSKVVVKEIERIDGLVARLRELATRPAQQLATLDLRPPIEETLVLLRGVFEHKQIKIRRDYGEDVPLILGELNLLKQLFLNLFGNALDAMEPGGELGVRLGTRENLGSRILVVEVTDTGMSIPEGILPQIFDPFFSTKPGGSGLGLSICRSIADAHRASLRARNNSNGRGATFTIEFPVVSEPSQMHHGRAITRRGNAVG
jgi:signal transduction histidine kinase